MSIWLKIVLVASGGSLGALSRSFVSEWVAGHYDDRVAAGTFAVNVLGCLFFGVARGAVDGFEWGTPEMHAFLFTGLLGAFTTFSTFEADLVGLWYAGQRLWAMVYVAGSVIAGLTAFVIGWQGMLKIYG